jgi:hypothetical protein
MLRRRAARLPMTLSARQFALAPRTTVPRASAPRVVALIAIGLLALAAPGVCPAAPAAQPAQPPAAQPLRKATAAKAGTAPVGRQPFRAVAPGVEITIPPDKQEDETVSTHDIVEIVKGIPNLKWTPKTAPETETLYQMATDVEFRRDIWCLEFTFKPVRMIWVDVPQVSGKMQRKLIWYLLYHVTNRGQQFHPTRTPTGTYDIKPADSEIRFLPQFVLESHEYKKAYLDRLIPVAIEAIRKKEDPNRKLLNSVEIATHRIPLSADNLDQPVWAVATWEDIDPRIDTFSIAIGGLTNAYRWTDRPDDFHEGDPPGKGRIFTQKMLVLNFWRPGDEFVEDQRVIRYGIPGKVDYSWVYR